MLTSAASSMATTTPPASTTCAAARPGSTPPPGIDGTHRDEKRENDEGRVEYQAAQIDDPLRQLAHLSPHRDVGAEIVDDPSVEDELTDANHEEPEDHQRRQDQRTSWLWVIALIKVPDREVAGSDRQHPA